MSLKDVTSVLNIQNTTIKNNIYNINQYYKINKQQKLLKVKKLTI